MKKTVKSITALLMALTLVMSAFTGMTVTPASAEEGVVVKLHYHRPDNSYDGWDVWFWEDGQDGGGYPFVNEGGDMVSTITLTPGTVKLGFIVRIESTWEKDISEDQFIDVPEVTSGTVHVYVESQVKGYTKSYGEDVVLGIKMISAVYNNDRTITVTLTAPIEDLAEAFTVKGKAGDVQLTGVSEVGEGVYTVIVNEDLDLLSNYSITFDGTEYSVKMPVLYSTADFEEKYTYEGDDLGAAWSAEQTRFRVWAPTAEEAYVNLYESGDEGADDLMESILMDEAENGTWTARAFGDLNGVYYTYSVLVGGELVEAVDPYARTTGANGKRGMVIDLDSTDPEGWENDSNPHAGERMTDAIIYEGHIRDLTVNSEANVSKKGKFLGLAETGTKTSGGVPTALDHMVDLGITHLHILPMYDFGSVDETSPLNKYNWGYDPVNYNVPEGSYSTDPSDGAVRVGEVKTMVKALHDNGISVVMDVVYNHVYNADEFCVNKLVPGYFSRITETGTKSNGSGCGNDTATERSMVRKYIVDSVNYWVEEYHIDGFRFDLVGLMDTDTINEIVETVHENHPDVIFYGEGWSMTTLVTKDDVTLATQPNSALTPDFAYFNDTIRDSLKGSVFNTGAGFVSGAAGYESKLERCFLGDDNWCSSPSQTINYASCHDNNTLYDRITLSRSDSSTEDIIRMNNLSAAIYMTSEGIPFMSAGEEMLRSKTKKDGSFDSNSYSSGDTVNTLKWANLEDPTYAAVYEYYKGLISFRKEHASLRLATADEVTQYVSVIGELPEQMIGFDVKGGTEGEPSDEIVLFFNAADEPVEVELPEGEWNICVNADKAGTTSLGTVSGKVSVDRLGALILVKGELELNKPADDSTDGQTAPVSSETLNGNPASSDDPTDSDSLGVSKGSIIAIAVLAIGVAVLAVARKRKKG